MGIDPLVDTRDVCLVVCYFQLIQPTNQPTTTIGTTQGGGEQTKEQSGTGKKGKIKELDLMH